MAQLLTPAADQLGTTQGAGFASNWDWKGTYVSSFQGVDGLERTSQLTATPDTTLLLAGPARFSAVSSASSSLTPIGLTDGISVQASPSLQRLFEIGSNRSFFTRGKTISNCSFSKILADQANILAACSQNAYEPFTNDLGTKAPGAASPNPSIMMNLDSEYFAVPFGLLLVFKTRGENADGTGTILTASYLEYCMFSNYSFSIQNASPIIMEGLAIEFDRVVPVSLA